MRYKDENFYEYIYKLFYNFSQVKHDDVGLVLSKKVTHPVLSVETDTSMIMPIPKMVDEKYVLNQLLFDDTEEGRKSMWSIFLATIYHLAGHAAVSTYHNYDLWRKNKTDEISWKVIDFIEDLKVERFISHRDKEICKNLEHIDDIVLSKIKEKHNKKNICFDTKNKKKCEIIRNKILSNAQSDVNLADYLYNNREILSEYKLPYAEQHVLKPVIKFDEVGPVLKPFGEFDEQVSLLDHLWEQDSKAKRMLLRNYKRHLKNLQFDAIVIPPGNLQSFAQIKSKTLPMLRRIRQQIKLISNLTDEPKIDEIGYVDMQMAIQSIASEGHSNQIFERDEHRRGQEAWIILVDKSASMNLRFDRIKEFTVCVSESANDLTGKPDAWALYSFDNNFQILKDFKERYGHEVQARIGGLESNGLSLLPDAIELSTRILSEDPREKKYLFVITDGHPTGYERVSEAFSKTVRKTEVSGLTLVAIGVSKARARTFKNTVRGNDMRQLVAKFITAYRTASSSDM